MKINKKFIDRLIIRREVPISSLLAKDELNMFDSKDDPSGLLFRMDSIIYTIRLLLNEKLVEMTANSNTSVPDYEWGRQLKSPEDIYHLHYTHNEFKKYYGMMLKVKPEIFIFQKRFYKTEKQLKDIRDLWLPIIVAILAAILTSVFTAFFQRPIDLFCF